MRKTALYLGGLFLATGAALAVSAPAQAAPSTPTCGYQGYYNCYQPYYQRPTVNNVSSQKAYTNQIGKYNSSITVQNSAQAGDDNNIWGW
ncbi:hypothetical protein FHR83_002625 [Actinoplanes campanulatus]|uniref:Peptidase inhibitor family I36 n=1 Tax=Actinoplanes campanulatus TaxID=113559 RepID=A0A7W5FE46_9ACTN|nr:hypothetical protein [Actinoplanes campanulatus]MBB3094962.1 hypothetical protein [Actinoplanes campanulatus]GGN08592.1 hypothetical protein GCM10010109_17510 [Actinoplanes campanulatus]GID36257.1 hypothetical protein Aca09nite_27630 [Actinoplanes campanulatus]